MRFKNFYSNYLTERIPGKSYDYASTQIDINYATSPLQVGEKPLHERIYDWGLENISNSTLDPNDGRQAKDDIHCTVLYGLLADDSKEVEPYIKAFNPFEIELGNISLFKNEKQDVVKIDVKYNFKLEQLHKFIKNNVPNEYKFPEYKPHVTVSYVRPNTCDHLIGDKTFNGTKIWVSAIQFSSKEGVKTPISLYDYNKNLNKYGQI